MKVFVIGSTDVDYTIAWHYAAAFAHLGHEVERIPDPRTDAGLFIDDMAVDVKIGRRAGLPEHLEHVGQHLFTDDGVWAAQNPVWLGAQVHYLRAACHGPEAHESEPYPPWQPLWDVAFVGSSPGHPEWPHRAELVAHLREWFGDRFIHVGPGGQTVLDDSGNHRAELHGHWLNRFYRSVPIVIGDSVLHDERSPYWSERVYETWARGGFLLHPWNRLLSEEVGAHPGWPLGDWSYLDGVIDHWLGSPVERARECAAKQEFMRTHCTYEHRASELLATLGVS